METSNRRKIVPLIIVVVLLIALPVILFLVRQTQIFQPKAAQNQQGPRINVYDVNNDSLLQTDNNGNPISNSNKVKLRIFYATPAP